MGTAGCQLCRHCQPCDVRSCLSPTATRRQHRTQPTRRPPPLESMRQTRCHTPTACTTRVRSTSAPGARQCPQPRSNPAREKCSPSEPKSRPRRPPPCPARTPGGMDSVLGPPTNHRGQEAGHLVHVHLRPMTRVQRSWTRCWQRSWARRMPQSARLKRTARRIHACPGGRGTLQWCALCLS